MSAESVVDRMDGRLVWILARASQRLGEDLAQRLKPEGLAIEQFWILESLVRGGPAPMNGLAKVALVEPPTMTKIIDRMVSAGLVFRTPDSHDRRKILITPTDEGQAVHARISSVIVDQEQHIEQILDGESKEKLRSLLVSLI